MSIAVPRIELPSGVTRRNLLNRIGRVAAAAALAPCLSRISMIPSEDASVRIASSLVRGNTSVFEADAQGLEIVATLLAIGAAVVTILEYLGISPFFRKQVDYAPATAGRCQYQFQDYHAKWTNNGYQTFAGISRSPLEQPMMCLSAADCAQIDRSTQVEMASLYGDSGTMLLRGKELSVVQAAAQVAKESCGLSDAERAKIVCVTSSTPIAVEQKTVWRYCNAQGGYILYSPDAGSCGKMAVHVAGSTDPFHPLRTKLKV